MPHLSSRRAQGVSVLATLGALLAGLALVAIPSARAADRSIALILDYYVAHTCTVYPNYEKAGVVGNHIGWTIAPGEIVAWRYNINSTWAMISDKKYRNSSTHPWWGITQQACIGGSVGGEAYPTASSSYPAGVPIPTRLLEGRSSVEPDGWRSVDFSPPSATTIDPHRLVTSKGTLRDGANNFVIGNVFAGWHVHQTNQTAGGWTKVYVPNAQRWGWVENIHL